MRKKLYHMFICTKHDYMIKLKTSLRKKMKRETTASRDVFFYCLETFILYKRLDITIELIYYYINLYIAQEIVILKLSYKKFIIIQEVSLH